MKSLKNIFFLLLLGVFTNSNGQSENLSAKIKNADFLASGNYKDVLISFYQLALKNLNGPQKNLSFSSNPYAIMLRADPSLAIDKEYKRLTFLRRLNFNFDISLDSSFRLNGFSSAIKYAIVDNRDITVSDKFNDMVMANKIEFTKLRDAIRIKRSGIKDSIQNALIKDQTQKLLEDSTFSYSQLHPDVKAIVTKIIQDSNLSVIQKLITSNADVIFKKNKSEGYESIKKYFQNKALWTVGISDTAHSNGKLFKSVEINSQFLKGIVDPERSANLELDIKATASFIDDELKTGKNLTRQVFIFEPGLNLVLKGKNSQSYLEFKLSGSYINVWKGLFAQENKITNTINGTLRLRVLNEFWIPLKITYDTKTGNVFGFLNVVTNFTGLAKFLNSK